MRLVLLSTLVVLMSGCSLQYKNCKIDPSADVTVQEKKVEVGKDGVEQSDKQSNDVEVIGDHTIRIQPKALLSCPF